tara:strand:+ start:1085 stop:1606 length:522 start_codon:yes stop_codon:yes gene_type:complete
MSKKIIKIEQIEEGGKNEKGDIVDKLWKLYFESKEVRILDKRQLKDLAQSGTSPPKTIFSVTRWGSTFPATLTDKVFHWWIIVYEDKNHTVLLPNAFYDLLYQGHRNEEDKIDNDKIKIEAPPNPALFTERITTPEEKEEIKRLRQEIDAEEAFKLGLHLHDDEKEEIKEENK